MSSLGISELARLPVRCAWAATGLETIVVNGRETGVFKFDLERVKSVMRPIANAIHFWDYAEAYAGKWNVFITSLRFWEDLAGQPNQWEPFRNLLATIQFVVKPVPQPAIFTYAVHEMPDGLVFEFVFYGAFTIHCFGPRPGKALAV